MAKPPIGSAYSAIFDTVEDAALGSAYSDIADVIQQQLLEEFLKAVVETYQQMTIKALERLVALLYARDIGALTRIFLPPSEPKAIPQTLQRRYRFQQLISVLGQPPVIPAPEAVAKPPPLPGGQTALDAVTDALTMTPEHLAPMKDAIASGFNSTGYATGEAIPVKVVPPGFRFKLQFDVRNPRAEQWISTESSTLVQEIVDDQRVMIREYLTEALAVGKGPRNTALDIVGRINPRTGLREGGVIGLHSIQARWVANYEREIASTDPAMLGKALLRGLRDKRFDRSIQQAINSGQPISADKQAKMRMAYANNALRYRGENIARTETARAMGAAQHEAYQQAIDRDILKQQHMRRYWVTVGDERVRFDHRKIPGMNKGGVAWNEPFQTPTGPSMHAPHDRDINCRCMERVRIDWRGLRRAQEAEAARAA